MRKNILGIILGSLFVPMIYGASFNAKNTQINYNIEIKKNVDLRIKLSPEKKLCNTQLSLIDFDNKVILKAEHMMNKGDVIFNAPVKSGKYILRYEALSLCGNTNFNIGLTKISGNFEVEINDAPNNATVIKELNYNYGYLQRYDDIDYFQFDIDKDSDIKLYFEHKIINSFGGFKITVLDENLKSIKSFLSSAKSLKDMQQISLKKGKYFVKIEKNDSSSKVQHHRYSIVYVVVKK